MLKRLRDKLRRRRGDHFLDLRPFVWRTFAGARRRVALVRRPKEPGR